MRFPGGGSPLLPNPVNFGLALGTAAVLEVVAPDGVPQPLDEQLPAGIAIRVLALLPRDVPHIDIAESGCQADFPGPHQGGHRGGGPVHHFEGGVKRGDVPGDGRAHAFDEVGDLGEFGLRVVVSRDNQGGDLHPDPQLLQSGDGVQHRLQPGLAYLAVEIVPHALQIQVVGVDELRGGGGGRLCHEAVGDKNIAQAVFPGQASHVLGVLEEDGGLGVGVRDAGRMGPQGIGHDGFGVAFVPQDLAAVDPGILGDVIVLAVEAHEVTARGGDGIGPGARQEVEQGLFLNGVNVLGYNFTIIEAVEGAVLVLPDVAEAPFARIDLASVGAQVAQDLLIFRTFPKPGLVHRVSLRRRQNYHICLKGRCKGVRRRPGPGRGPQLPGRQTFAAFDAAAVTALLPGIDSCGTNQFDGGRSSVGRAPGCGPGGRGFKSRRSPQKFQGVRLIGLTPLFLFPTLFPTYPANLDFKGMALCPCAWPDRLSWGLLGRHCRGAGPKDNLDVNLLLGVPLAAASRGAVSLPHIALEKSSPRRPLTFLLR